MQKRLIASDGTPLVYADIGPPGGDTIVLCHGLGAGGAQFADDAAWLAGEGYRVLVPDLRGHGGSGMPPDLSAPSFAPQRLMADLVEMLDHAGVDRVLFVGNSLGGILGLHLARAHPERLGALVLFGTALSLSLALPDIGLLLRLLDRFPGRNALAAMTAWSTTREKAARPLIAGLLCQYDFRAISRIVDHVRRYDLRDAALGWNGPGLVLVGGRDHAVNRALLPQLGALRGQANWRIEHLPKAGHCANLDAGAAWRAALLSFLQATRSET